MQAPFGISKVWTVDAAIAEVAAHYALAPKSLKHGNARGVGAMAEARDALCWVLTQQRKLSQARAAQLLLLTAKSVREGARRHAGRMAAFKARFLPQDAA